MAVGGVVAEDGRGEVEEEEEQLPPQHRPRSTTGPLIKRRQCAPRSGSGMEINLSYLLLLFHSVMGFSING